MFNEHIYQLGLPCGSNSKEFACSAEDMYLIRGSGSYPREGKATHSSILAWETPLTERSLVGYNPWGCKESDVT